MPTETDVQGDALCFMVMTWAGHKTREALLNNDWRLAAVGGWRRLAVGRWWLLVVSGWRLVVHGGWRVAVGGGWRLAVGGPCGLSFTEKKLRFLRTALIPGASGIHPVPVIVLVGGGGTRGARGDRERAVLQQTTGAAPGAPATGRSTGLLHRNRPRTAEGCSRARWPPAARRSGPPDGTAPRPPAPARGCTARCGT